MRNQAFKVVVLVAGLAIVFAWPVAHAQTSASKDGKAPGMTSPQTKALSPQQQHYLLSLARNTLINYLGGRKGEKLSREGVTPLLEEKRGCFVTLMKNGDLRGCIGHILPMKPLCDCVRENAINAAVHDPRFPAPVSAEELGSITIEISVLTVPEKLELKERSEVLKLLVPMRDGVILKNGWYQSTYLPQVWEHFPDKEDFLNSLCEKGGMAANCWRDDNTEVLTYQAQVFSEKKE